MMNSASEIERENPEAGISGRRLRKPLSHALRHSSMKLFSCASIACLLLCAQAMRAQAKAAPTKPENPWLNFHASALNGKPFELRQTGNLATLVFFINIAEEDNNSCSRSQAVVAQSLDWQYAAKGIRIVAVDERADCHGAKFEREQLATAAAHWHLSFDVLTDPDATLCHALRLHALPATILVSPSGNEIARWQGYVRTPVLAQAIERLTGGPLGNAPQGSMQPEIHPNNSSSSPHP